MTTFKISADDIAIRNEIEEISRLDREDATNFTVKNIIMFRRKLALGQTPTQIALEYHLTNMLHLSQVEVIRVLNYFGENAREEVAKLQHEDEVRSLLHSMNLYVVCSNGQYFTGRAGEGWVSNDRCEAFPMTREYADRTMAQFNNTSRLHGLTFVVE